MAVDLKSYSNKLHEIANECVDTVASDGKDVAIPSLNSLQSTLNIIDNETNNQMKAENILNLQNSNIFDYHTLVTQTINTNLSFVKCILSIFLSNSEIRLQHCGLSRKRFCDVFFTFL